ncbi:MAG: hypothetical protein DSM106950_39940 [Stigonema ocellatum SAG 48.90 = DSM 106950]|nr:hypothetical protein [Stigonema ocellatum SAG 48.90 = DSM 106950]
MCATKGENWVGRAIALRYAASVNCIVAGLYGVDYEEVVAECGVDDPSAIILFMKVTKK